MVDAFGVCWGCNQNASLEKPFLLCSTCNDINLHLLKLHDDAVRSDGTILTLRGQPTWKLRNIRLRKELELQDLLHIERSVGKSEKFWMTSDAVLLDIRKIDLELERRD